MKTGKKVSGGRYHAARKVKVREKIGEKRFVRLGAEKKKVLRVEGGNEKVVLLATDKVNVVKGGKAKVIKIKGILETPSNRFLARRNIMTKGTLIETDEGKVKIMNRPSQEGSVQGVFVE